MEEKRGLATYFTGLVRLIIFILLIVVVVVFVVRWASNRRSERKAEEVVKTAQESKKESSENESKETTKTDGNPIQAGDTGSKITQVPSGVAESGASPTPSQRVPNAGIGESGILSAAGLGVTTYFLVKNRQSLKHLKSPS